MPRDSTHPSLLLADFVPIRLNRLADAVSQDLSSIYRERFALEIPEWRVLVTVGERLGCTAQHIVLSTRMHKTRVSRAVASLRARKLLDRASSTADGREMQLHLSKAGLRLYGALVPLARARERALLACMDDAERASFLAGMSRLEESLRLSGDE